MHKLIKMQVYNIYYFLCLAFLHLDQPMRMHYVFTVCEFSNESTHLKLKFIFNGFIPQQHHKIFDF